MWFVSGFLFFLLATLLHGYRDYIIITSLKISCYGDIPRYVIKSLKLIVDLLLPLATHFGG